MFFLDQPTTEYRPPRDLDSEVCVTGKFRVLGDKTVARGVMRQMIRASRAERGCIYFDYAADKNDGRLFYILERWESREAFERHQQSGHRARWRSTWADLQIIMDDLLRISYPVV